MAVAKKDNQQGFSVLSLAEADSEYSALHARFSELNAEAAINSREQQALMVDLQKNPPTRHFRSDIAELLGDTVAVDERPHKLSELKKRHANLEAAIEILRRRLSDRRTQASVAVCAEVRPEFASRVSKLCKALVVCNEAHRALEELISQLEDRDVAWTSLGVLKPFFLGDARDGHVHRFIKESKEFGYAE